MKYKALVIGCGNIGALYDIEGVNISTHARALKCRGNYSTTFFDEDLEQASKAASTFNGVVLEKLSREDLSGYDWISICTPTDTHCTYLEMLEGLSPKIVLCEKPVSYSKEEIVQLDRQAVSTEHKIFVNYFRRFLPEYVKLKANYSHMLDIDKLKSCRIEYCRGFLNNGSHAFDLLEFLYDKPVEFMETEVSNMKFDAFKQDPTLSMTSNWNHVTMKAIGKDQSSGPLLNIDLSMQDGEIRFSDSGNRIEISERTNGKEHVVVWEDCLRDYMKHSVNHVLSSIVSGEKSNFSSSLALNSKMLDLIKE